MIDKALNIISVQIETKKFLDLIVQLKNFMPIFANTYVEIFFKYQLGI